MKIVVCGSMSFAKQMLEAQKQLEAQGHVCVLPEGVEGYANNQIEAVGGSEGARRKIEHDLIRDHYRKIKSADAILVLNHDKKGVTGYIGGNSFLEMGFAHILRKKIFLLNPAPVTEMLREEIEAMEPVVLRGNLGQIVAF